MTDDKINIAYQRFKYIFREQINALTAYIDASNVYGSDEGRNHQLRTHANGELKVNTDYLAELLPEIGGTLMAGEQRALEVPTLTAIHTLFLR